MTDWKGVVVFCVSALVLGGLIYTGHIPPAALAALGGWLIQSPLGKTLIAEATQPAPAPAPAAPPVAS